MARNKADDWLASVASGVTCLLTSVSSASANPDCDGNEPAFVSILRLWFYDQATNSCTAKVG